MGFLKRHLFFIVCGIGAAGGIALAVTGMGAMPDVIAEMKKAESLHNELVSLQSRPVNAAMIEAEQKRIDKMLGDCAQVREAAEQLYDYELLVDGVLPDGDNNLRIQFANTYRAKMQELLDSLNYGWKPNETEVNLMREKIATEAFREQQGLDPGARVLRPSVGDKPATTVAGVLTPAGAKENAEARASIGKALQIYCYALDRPTATLLRLQPTLQYSDPMMRTDSLEPPFLDSVWWAQVGFWIQRDVIGAIAKINEEAAARAKENDQDAWVGIMPVKDVISIRLSPGFIIDDDAFFIGPAAGGYDEAFPVSTKNTVFTQSVSSMSYDVMQFAIKLVMDQRDIPLLIDELSRDTFHTLLRVAYKAMPPNRKMEGKVYGSEPLANVVMEFETVLVPSVFRQWIPQDVCDYYDYLRCPERVEEGG